MKDEVLRELRAVVGDDWVITSKEQMESYLTDETSEVIRPKPAERILVVKPSKTDQVAEVLRVANRHGIPVFPRGGGTGLVGGAVPTQNGIVLSLERMDAVEIDRENMMAVVEAGATLGKLIENAENSGFAFPPHPGDEGAQIGGLIACNAGGARALKHGVMRNFVKGLEVVLANGEVLRLGGKLLKDNMGYSIMHLMIGSEGTLGVITKAILRLMPKFESTLTMVTPYSSRHEALSAVPKVLWRGILPMALEYVERDLMERSAEHLGEKWFVEGDVFLIFILAGREDDIYSEAEAISDVCRESGSSEPLVAERRDEQSTILKIRSNIYTALKKDTIDILDTTVPPNNIGKLADAIDAVATRYNTRLPLYGHAGDGNLHCHIMRNDLRNYSDMKRSIYDSTIALGGVITGEHGVGKLRVFELQRILPPQHIILMKELKRVFDPNNILNPSAVLS
jgi:glycolate oxidase